MSATCPRCGGTGKLVDPKTMRARRLAKGLRLVDVAKKMGIGVSYVSDLENGRRDLDADLVLRFEKALK